MRVYGSVINLPAGARFVPEEKPDRQLMLTAIPMQAAQEPREIDIESYAGSKISFDCQIMDDTWAWQVRDIALDAGDRGEGVQAYGSVIDTPEGPRFVPIDEPTFQLQLTEDGQHVGHEPQAIDIRSYVGQRIRFTCDAMSGGWAWGVSTEIEPY